MAANRLRSALRASLRSTNQSASHSSPAKPPPAQPVLLPTVPLHHSPPVPPATPAPRAPLQTQQHRQTRHPRRRVSEHRVLDRSGAALLFSFPHDIRPRLTCFSLFHPRASSCTASLAAPSHRTHNPLAVTDVNPQVSPRLHFFHFQVSLRGNTIQ
ncbi:hypothetical protein AGABI2DRAFT_122607 [Agaricus bisporus var. bisporus H97]|uniref:hypothetical protein n=1 Tax=Agaricus bisporus var. bisporus (strain H97 / ATCC MYA-4626 / FGSC 10389) TaxID=936046 RepID=UPI00029F7F60|nr:hypothetical protein AGABI2DRAFT_122607 [Agaricus bisporus var. bisporus H97]EKV42378.1 hypothetical protein AGABI2DRAFT_122607 [Agaricus bisporus var. bisporus H97]